MENNGLGISIKDMIDTNQMIDTDTGKIVTGVMPEEETKNPESKKPVQKESDKDLIEVNVDDTKPQGTVDTSGTEEDTLKNKEQHSSSSLPSFKVLANALYEKGVLSELDISTIEDGTEDEAEALINLIKGEIDKNVSSYKTALPKTIQDLIDNYEDNVPLDKLIGMKSTKMRLDNITEESLKEDVNLQKLIISENYKRLGISEAKIAKRIQQFDDLDQLEDESLEALADSKKFMEEALESERENAKLETKKMEEEREKNLKSLQDEINETTTLIEGINISDRERKNIYESMTKPQGKDSYGNPMNKVMVTRERNPVGFEKLLHYYHELGLFNIDKNGKLNPDISKIKAGAKASAMDELNSALREGHQTSSGSPAREQTVDRSKMKSNIDVMKGLFK